MESDEEKQNLKILFSKISGFSSNPFIFPLPNDSRRGLIGYTDRLSMSLLYSAYLQGIFPWFDESRDEPVLWWSPDPRFVLFPQNLHEPERLVRFLKHTPFTYTMDKAFEAVINGCSQAVRAGQNGTWIGKKIINAYGHLFQDGVAHSIEVWNGERLVGGFYGVLIGRIFFGESMFTLESNSAKSAFLLFVHAFRSAGGRLIDSQVYTDNIARFGGENISRDAFLHLENENLSVPLDKNLISVFYDTVEKESSLH